MIEGTLPSGRGAVVAISHTVLRTFLWFSVRVQNTSSACRVVCSPLVFASSQNLAPALRIRLHNSSLPSISAPQASKGVVTYLCVRSRRFPACLGICCGAVNNALVHSDIVPNTPRSGFCAFCASCLFISI